MLNSKLKKQIQKFDVSVPQHLKSLFKAISLTYDEVENLEKYKEIFKLSPEAIVILDKNGVMIDANERLKEWLGYDLKFVIGKHILKFPFLPKESKLIAIKKFLGRMVGKKIEPYNLRFVHKNGTEVIGKIFATPLKNSKGKIIYDLVLITDVTKQIKAEEKLKASERRFEDFATSSGDWFWEVDTKGKYVYVEGKVKKILGYSKKELIGKTPFDLMEKDEAKQIARKFKLIVENKKPIIDLENWNIAKDGKKICLLTNGLPIIDEKGNFIGYRGVDKDITDRKTSEEDLRRKLLEALSYSSEQLLKGANWDENISNILKSIGEAANVSRVYVFENFTDKNRILFTRQLYEWAAKGIVSQIDNKELRAFPVIKGGLGRWATTLGKGGIISGLIKDFPKAEKKILSPQDILSILIVPIKVNEKWWGFLGFDECKEERKWYSQEIDILKSVANIIGSALERDNVQNKIRKLNEDLVEKTKQTEQFNKLMVGRELKMIELKKEIVNFKSMLGKKK